MGGGECTFREVENDASAAANVRALLRSLQNDGAVLAHEGLEDFAGGPNEGAFLHAVEDALGDFVLVDAEASTHCAGLLVWSGGRGSKRTSGEGFEETLRRRRQTILWLFSLKSLFAQTLEQYWALQCEDRGKHSLLAVLAGKSRIQIRVGA